MRAWAHDGGFSVDGSVRIEGADRTGLEPGLPTALRYCARPPFALEHLHQRDAEPLLYRNPKPARTTAPGARPAALVLTPLALITKIAALVPPPRAHRLVRAGRGENKTSRRSSCDDSCLRLGAWPPVATHRASGTVWGAIRMGFLQHGFSANRTPAGPKSAIDGCTRRQPYFPKARWISFPLSLNVREANLDTFHRCDPDGLRSGPGSDGAVLLPGGSACLYRP